MGFDNGRLVRVSLEADFQDRQVVNTFHYDLEGGVFDANSVQDLADRFRDDVRPTWAAFFNTSWTIKPVSVVEEKDPQNPSAARSAWESGSDTPGTGTTSSDYLPSFCTAVVTLRTSSIGRRFRGRLFLPGEQSESTQTNGDWSDTQMAVWEAFIATVPKQPDLAEGPSGSQANWCVYSRTQRAQNKNPYAPAITTHVVRRRVHSLRTRANY